MSRRLLALGVGMALALSTMGSGGTAFAQACQVDASAGTSGSTEMLPRGQCATDVNNDTSGQNTSIGSQTAAQGAGTAAVQPPEVASQAGSLSPQQLAQQALVGFFNYTDQNWSVQGFSSPQQMRSVLGGDWLIQTEQLAGS
ncbi:MAG: hypothetical protein IT307_09200 [Chloroflexi bacterium]|nr:hypothetical protein [Chloroflexota bacterium]